jgi:hypothetical protein
VAQTFEIADVILAAMSTRMATVFTAMPGRVVSYDAARQRADVQPTVHGAYLGETGDRVVDPYPTIPSVPVMFLGGGGARTTYPVARGDTCLLLFANCSLDRWLTQGGDVDPRDERRHCLSDAVAIVGLRDAKHVLKNAPTDRVSIGYDTGASVEIHPDQVRLGGDDATSDVVVQDALGDFMNALDAAVPGAGTASPALTSLATQLRALHGGAGWKARTSKTKAR